MIAALSATWRIPPRPSTASPKRRSRSLRLGRGLVARFETGRSSAGSLRRDELGDRLRQLRPAAPATVRRRSSRPRASGQPRKNRRISTSGKPSADDHRDREGSGGSAGLQSGGRLSRGPSNGGLRARYRYRNGGLVTVLDCAATLLCADFSGTGPSKNAERRWFVHSFDSARVHLRHRRSCRAWHS